MPPPLPRCSSGASSSLISPRRVSLPRKGGRVGLHIVLFEDSSAFTRVAACILALSPIRDTLIEGFSHFVTSMTAPIASGWSESPGGPCTHSKAPPCHGAHPKPSFAIRHSPNSLCAELTPWPWRPTPLPGNLCETARANPLLEAGARSAGQWFALTGSNFGRRSARCRACCGSQSSGCLLRRGLSLAARVTQPNN
jgi:hypothetical protein